MGGKKRFKPLRQPLPAQVHEITIGLSFAYAELDDLARRARLLLEDSFKLVSTKDPKGKEWRKEARALIRAMNNLPDDYQFEVVRPRLFVVNHERDY